MTRLAQHVVGSAVLLVASLAIGMAGYMHFMNMGVVDAFLNAAMLLGGMGPVASAVDLSVSGKVFAGVSAALVITPLAHRVLHKFHWDEKL